MRQTKIAAIELDIDNYIEIKDFKNLIKKKVNSSIVAVIIGCVEGIIKPSKDKEYYSFAGMYKVKNSKYMLLNMYNLINNNKKIYNYIVNYFNLWHNNECEEFSYDEFSRDDLRNNFYELVSLIYEEQSNAQNLNDKKEAEAYNTIISSLSNLFSNTIINV